MLMAFRSHVGRPLDLALRSNRAIAAIAGTSLVVAIVLAVLDRSLDFLVAPVHVFLFWAWLREIDPDHNWTAIAAASGVAVWFFGGLPITSAGATLALMEAARLVVRTTGRRPLSSDIVGLGVIAVLVSYSTSGWLAGIALSVAIFWDGRLDASPRRLTDLAAVISALGATLVATVFDALPVPTATFAGVPVGFAAVVALILILRPAAQPESLVDAGHKNPIGGRRLRRGRALTATAVLPIVALVADETATWPLIGALGLIGLVNELDLVRRRAG